MLKFILETFVLFEFAVLLVKLFVSVLPTLIALALALSDKRFRARTALKFLIIISDNTPLGANDRKKIELDKACATKATINTLLLSNNSGMSSDFDQKHVSSNFPCGSGSPQSGDSNGDVETDNPPVFSDMEIETAQALLQLGSMPPDIDTLLTQANALSQAHMDFCHTVAAESGAGAGAGTKGKAKGGVSIRRTKRSRGHKRESSLLKLKQILTQQPASAPAQAGIDPLSVSLRRRYGYAIRQRNHRVKGMFGKQALHEAMKLASQSLSRLEEQDEDGDEERKEEKKRQQNGERK
ncbi:hypothetical protein IAT40_003876 [Kwoniella sp. CBS 6097]